MKNYNESIALIKIIKNVNIKQIGKLLFIRKYKLGNRCLGALDYLVNYHNYRFKFVSELPMKGKI